MLNKSRSAHPTRNIPRIDGLLPGLEHCSAMRAVVVPAPRRMELERVGIAMVSHTGLQPGGTVQGGDKGGQNSQGKKKGPGACKFHIREASG